MEKERGDFLMWRMQKSEKFRMDPIAAEEPSKAQPLAIHLKPRFDSEISRMAQKAPRKLQSSQTTQPSGFEGEFGPELPCTFLNVRFCGFRTLFSLYR